MRIAAANAIRATYDSKAVSRKRSATAAPTVSKCAVKAVSAAASSLAAMACPNAACADKVLRQDRRFANASSDRTTRNPDWDWAFRYALDAGQLDASSRLDDSHVTRAAGAAGHQVRTWLAAAGLYRARRLYYRPIDPWITGFGVVTALPA